ncbi:DUF2249 domain-containing protein [Halostella sp. JP-L12]|uniref:DUF2249 domain-containing protein n=1 Tax=Halostella TaxID=1843185 RepID=UPI000EF7EB8C|nr:MULTISPECIES: DUF2249 domain-containing protein [Halostella]NHN49157.1 DUF2249 domain-containing protein [Halostella sp. JP-L12]
MTLDLRDRPRADRSEQVFDLLDDVDGGDSVDIVGPRRTELYLQWYQIKRGRQLDWRTTRADDALEVSVTKAEPFGDGERSEFDVREMPPQRRHEVLLDTFDALDPEEGFVLVNDHDPKPLYHELRSTRGDVIDWEYLSEGSNEWRVEIVKTGASDPADDGVVTKFDVREIPKPERHPTIHHRYGMIPDGGTMEIVAPHEPRPLYGEFRERYGESFSWDVIEDEPGRCRVQITKAEDAETGSGDDSAAAQSLEVTAEIDVRDLPPARRHEKIFEEYEGLRSGEAFVLVNDHDPKPLYHQFEAEAGDEFRWEYRLKDPGKFRVLIGKADASGTETTTNETPNAPF